MQYGVTALCFLLIGFLLMILMRWQLAWPGQPLPAWLASWLGESNTPGMTSRIWFTPTRTGDWEIACSQLCGLGHYRMRGEYHVVTEEGWNRWQADELARLAR